MMIMDIRRINPSYMNKGKSYSFSVHDNQSNHTHFKQKKNQNLISLFVLNYNEVIRVMRKLTYHCTYKTAPRTGMSGNHCLMSAKFSFNYNQRSLFRIHLFCLTLLELLFRAFNNA